MQFKLFRTLRDPLLSWLDGRLYPGSSHLRRRKAEQNRARSASYLLDSIIMRRFLSLMEVVSLDVVIRMLLD